MIYPKSKRLCDHQIWYIWVSSRSRLSIPTFLISSIPCFVIFVKICVCYPIQEHFMFSFYDVYRFDEKNLNILRNSYHPSQVQSSKDKVSSDA
ncbi:hypothetical protein MKX01_007107, partial [Papaver californicum]